MDAENVRQQSGGHDMKMAGPRMFTDAGRLLLVVALSAGAATAAAASFDCSRAVDGVEKLVCSDPGLSALDDELDAAYRGRMKMDRPDDLRRDQRRWISDVRNRCGDIACLAAAYRTRISSLSKPSGAAGPHCGVDETVISGSWRNVSRGDFDEFVLDGGEKHGFMSWLQHRPEFSGRWELAGCMLHIKNDHDQ